jgi:hypothetical protein
LSRLNFYNGFFFLFTGLRIKAIGSVNFLFPFSVTRTKTKHIPVVGRIVLLVGCGGFRPGDARMVVLHRGVEINVVRTSFRAVRSACSTSGARSMQKRLLACMWYARVPPLLSLCASLLTLARAKAFQLIFCG